MLASLVLLSSLAVAGPRTEVGDTKVFGAGVQLGWPMTGTVKYFLSDNHGVSAHLGGWFAGLGWVELRGQYEMRVIEFADWKFADLGGYWNAGALFNKLFVPDYLYPNYAGRTVQVGICGGVGAEMRFKDVPAAVFAETDLRVYVYGPESGALAGANNWGPAVAAGGRWYF